MDKQVEHSCESRGFDNHRKHDPQLLFDLSTDLGEQFDIVAAQPEMVGRIW